MQTRHRGKSTIFNRVTGVDPDSTNEALIVAIFLGCCWLVYIGFVIHSAKKSREHPPQHTSLVEYEFPMDFPEVQIMSPSSPGLPPSALTMLNVNCTFQKQIVNTTKFCCPQREPSRKHSHPNIDLKAPHREWPEQAESEEEEETTYSPQAESEEEEETTYSPKKCIPPNQEIGCIGEMLSISGLIMNSFEDSLTCDIVLQDSSFAQIYFCIENCDDMSNFGLSGTHWLQEGRLDWLEFSSERHTYLSESKPNKHRIQITQGFLNADVEALEARMNFELRAKSDSYLLVAEEDPVHRFDILTSILAASSFLYMFFNLCFALPFRKRFRCRFSDEAIDYNRLTMALSPTADPYSEYAGEHVTPIILDRPQNWEDKVYEPPEVDPVKKTHRKQDSWE